MSIQLDLVTACIQHGKTITGLTHQNVPVPGHRLLLTIAGLESNFGELREFVRSEAAYVPGGKYYSRSPEVRQLFRRWGCLASSSFGTFQIMYVTATELGYTDHPIRLQEDKIGGYWAGQLIQKRFMAHNGAKTLRDVLDAYNSGNHSDRIVPVAYVEKGIKIYENLEGV